MANIRITISRVVNGAGSDRFSPTRSPAGRESDAQRRRKREHGVWPGSSLYNAAIIFVLLSLHYEVHFGVMIQSYLKVCEYAIATRAHTDGCIAACRLLRSELDSVEGYNHCLSDWTVLPRELFAVEAVQSISGDAAAEDVGESD